MAIDLPPVIPPQQSSAARIAEYIPAGSPVIETWVKGQAVQISGNRYLDAAEINEIFALADTPSNAIRALNRAYYNAGHLLVTLYYALGDGKLFVHVINGKLSALQGPETITQYFSGLVEDDDLTIPEFDRRRVLADLRAKRAGIDYKITYKLKGDPQAYSMVFTPQAAANYDNTDVDFQVGNQGNRFVGRYFGSAGWTERFQNGVELRLGVDKALPDLGEASGGKEYDGVQFKLDFPSAGGLYGIEANRVTYERTLFLSEPLLIPQDDLVVAQTPPLPPLTFPQDPIEVNSVDLESQTSDVSLTGEQVILSSTRHRLSTVERLEHVNSSIDTIGYGNLLDEVYTSLELGLKYSRKIEMFGKNGRVSAQGFVKGGLSTDDGTFNTDERDDVVSIGKRSAEYLLVRPKLALRLDFTDWLNGQIDVIGQWSDGKQVPQKQQFVLGGMSTLSAWLPGILVGDTGAFTRLKLETRAFEWLGGKHTVSLFVEMAQVSNEDVGGAAADSRELSDGGLRYTGKWPWDIEMTFVAAGELDSDNVSKELLSAASADFFWRLKKTF